MYFVVVALLLVILPAGSVFYEVSVAHSAVALPYLIGKWFVFWGVGVRLMIAGLRQMIQPRFTAEEIFGIAEERPRLIVRELGMANTALGTLGVMTQLFPGFLVPSALTGAIFYGLAGVGHMLATGRNAKQNTAMASDIFIAAVLAYSVLSNARYMF